MIIRKEHKFEIASLRDAEIVLVFNPQTALRLSGVNKIKPLVYLHRKKYDYLCKIK